MRLNFNLELGPLRIIFDPFGVFDEEEAETEEWPPMPTYHGTDSSTDRDFDDHPPELKVGHRDPWYDDRRIGFSAKGKP